MDVLLLAYYYSSPFLMAFGAAAVLVVIGGMAWNFPLLPALAFLTVVFGFSSSTYGLLNQGGSTIYSRGSGQLYFPFVVWLLAMGAIWMSFAGQTRLSRVSLSPPPSPSIQRWFLLWFVLLLCHICVGLLVAQPITEILDGNGFIYLPMVGLLVTLIVAGARDARSIASLALFIELATLAKASYGLVRWAAFGGDPANVYANVEKLAVKLTFFDIGDSLVCLLGMGVAASMLFIRRPKSEGFWHRALHWAVLSLGLACVVLSFRRTVWLGLLISFAWLIWHLKPHQRFAALGLAAPVLLAAIGFVAYKRLGAQVDKLGLMSVVYDLIGSRYGGEGARVLELRLAANEFLASPLWGNGAWGRYAATGQIAWQDATRAGNFLHSGVLHVAMKTGLIGLALLAGVVASFMRQTRALKSLDASSQALVAAGCMGLLFMVPDFLGGTPVVQFRTMQLIGVCLALPFFVARAQAPSAAAA